MQVKKTVVFADVCDSTSLFERLGNERARALIKDMLDRLAGQTRLYGGEVVKSLGDGMFSSFDKADDAASYALGAQRYAESSEESVELRIGLVEGGVIIEGGDLFGDAVNVAARLSDLAGKGQIFTTVETIDVIQAEKEVDTRPLGPRQVKGRREPLEVVEILWEEEQKAYTSLRFTPMMQDVLKRVIRLSWQDQTAELSSGGEDYHLTLGRSPENTVQVDNPEASRRHATIELRNRNFYLIDHSTNGSYVTAPDGSAIPVRREAFLLTGAGAIGLGMVPNPGAENIINYSILEGADLEASA